jgi:photosystem II stability/assembly factor-like uncharacterized protein
MIGYDKFYFWLMKLIKSLVVLTLFLNGLPVQAQWRDAIGNIDDAHAQNTYFNDLFFFNPNYGFAVGDRSTILSFDGVSWKKQQALSDAASAFYGISFSADTNGWIIGENATFYQYNKSNNSWTFFKNVEIDKKDISKDNKVLIDLKGVFTISKTSAWAVADGQHIYYFDGKKWRKTTCEGANEQLYSIQFVNNIGFAVGENGIIIKYENGKWSKMVTPTINKLRSISMIDENYGFAVGENGTFLVLENGIWNKIQVNGSEGLRLRSVYALSDKKAWAVGDRGSMFCFDGKNWSSCNNNKFTNNILTKVLFTGEGQGWVCGQNSFMNYEISVDDEFNSKRTDMNASNADKNVPK